jgi:quercetin dioxygenase-like cupin family protein
VGEEFVLCLRGSFYLTVGEERHLLGDGDAAMFWSGEPHQYEPAAPVKHGEEPPLVLSIRIDGLPE